MTRYRFQTLNVHAVVWVVPLLGLLWLMPGPVDAQAPEGQQTTVHLSGSWSSEIAAPFELREDMRAWGLRAELDWQWRIRPYVGASRVSLGVDCVLEGGVVCPEPKGWVLVAGGLVDLVSDPAGARIVPYVGGEAGTLIRSGESDLAWAALVGLRVPVHRHLSLTGEFRRARLEGVIDQHWQALVGVRVSR